MSLEPEEFTERLLEWFGVHAGTSCLAAESHALPVWVSEVMLQQTQVATVMPYTMRFMAAMSDDAVGWRGAAG